MQVIQSVATVDASLQNEELSILSQEIFTKIDEIKELVVDETQGVASSALFALLCSVKKTNPNINIALLNQSAFRLQGIGLMSLKRG